MCKNSLILFGILFLICISFLSSCRKEPYIPEYVSPRSKCLLLDYTLSAYAPNGGANIRGNIDYYFNNNDEIIGYDDDNADISINYPYSERNLSVVWEGRPYQFFMTPDGWPQYVNFQLPGNVTVSVEANYTSNKKLREVKASYLHNNTNNDRVHVIDQIEYESGNLVSYRYTVRERSGNNTILSTEYHSFDYIEELSYYLGERPDDKLFSIVPKTMLATNNQYSFKDLFDPQAFSTNLIYVKRNSNTDEVLFTKSYSIGQLDLTISSFQSILPGTGQEGQVTVNYGFYCN